MMLSWHFSCWSHSHFILAQLISCVYWNSNSGPLPHSTVQEQRVLTNFPPFPTHLCILLTWGTLFCCLSPESSRHEHIQPPPVFALGLVRPFWHAETCINPFPLPSLWNMKLQAIFNQFWGAFVSCWFGNEEGFSRGWASGQGLWAVLLPPGTLRKE